MNTSMERIKLDFDAFRQRVESYREKYANPRLQKDCCEAAYEGLYRLNQRIKKELGSGTLDKQERCICHEIRDDNFLNGLLELRTVSVHIQSNTAQKRGSIQFYMPSGQPVEISCEVSAGAAFSNNVFVLPESLSGIDKINHLDNLNTALERIRKKFASTHNKSLHPSTNRGARFPPGAPLNSRSVRLKDQTT